MAKISKGDRIAHRELDDKDLGTARTGITTEIIRDKDADHEVIIARYEDSGETVAFDSREISRVGKPIGSAKTPIILRPRHLWSVLKTRIGVLVITLATIAGIGLGIYADGAEWKPGYILVGLGAFLALILFLDFVLDRSRIVDADTGAADDNDSN